MILEALKTLFFKRNSGKALLKASIMLKQAIDEAEKKYKKNGHRYYVIYDPIQKKLISITYDLYDYRTDSYIYLKRRGRFLKSMSRNEIKEKCFYYTPSKNVPNKRCEGSDYQERLLKWQRYYSAFIMKK